MSQKTSADLDVAGFTLIEALVALAIVGLTLVALFQSTSDSMRTSTRSQDTVLATLHAESLLDALGVQEPLALGQQQGDLSDGFTWKLGVSLYRDARWASSEDLEGARVPLLVLVTVRAPSGEAVTLQTIRLAALP